MYQPPRNRTPMHDGGLTRSDEGFMPDVGISRMAGLVVSK